MKNVVVELSMIINQRPDPFALSLLFALFIGVLLVF